VLYAVGFLCFADQTIIIPSVLQYLTAIMRGESAATIRTYMSLTQTLFTLAQLVMTPIGAMIFQKLGKMRRLMISLVFIMALGNLMYVLGAPGIADSEFLVIAGRVVAGFGSGVSPLSYSYISVVVGPKERGGVVANFRGFSSIASVAAPAIAFALNFIHVPIGNFVLGDTTAPCLVTCLICIAVATAMIFLLEEPDKKNIKPPSGDSVWKHLTLPVAVLTLIMVGNGYANGSSTFYIPTVFVEQYHWTSGDISLLNAGIAVAVILTVLLVKFLNRYAYVRSGHGEKIILVVCNVGMIVGSLGLMIILGINPPGLVGTNRIVAIIVFIVFLYLFFSTQSTVIPSLFSKIVAPQQIAILMPLGVSGFQVGRLIAPFWGAMELVIQGYTLYFGFQAGLVLIFALILVATYKRIQPRGAPPAAAAAPPPPVAVNAD